MSAPAPDSARRGVPFDPADSHYRYVWTAQYDSLTHGPWLSQLDERGYALSPGILDPSRIVRLCFHPQHPALPPVEVRAQKELGECIRHLWTIDVPVSGAKPPTVCFVIVLEREVAGETVSTYLMLQEDGTICLGSRSNW